MKKILVIDDEPAIVNLCCDLFTREGFVVLSAANGLEGIDLACAKIPDLILLDIKMPVMDGLEALVRLKKDARTKNIKTVLFTAFGEVKLMEIDPKYASVVEETDVITKGIALCEFIGRVRRYVLPIEEAGPICAEA